MNKLLFIVEGDPDVMILMLHDYFYQRLECAAPKRWSKYTTFGC